MRYCVMARSSKIHDSILISQWMTPEIYHWLTVFLKKWYWSDFYLKLSVWHSLFDQGEVEMLLCESLIVHKKIQKIVNQSKVTSCCCWLVGWGFFWFVFFVCFFVVFFVIMKRKIINWHLHITFFWDMSVTTWTHFTKCSYIIWIDYITENKAVSFRNIQQ